MERKSEKIFDKQKFFQAKRYDLNKLLLRFYCIVSRGLSVAQQRCTTYFRILMEHFVLSGAIRYHGQGGGIANHPHFH